MKRAYTFGLIVVFGSTLHAQTVNVRGSVSDEAGKPVANAVVELVKLGVRDTTGSDGAYALTKEIVSIGSLSGTLTEVMRLDKGVLEFVVSEPGPLKVEVFDASGNFRKKESVRQAQPGIYHLDIAASAHTGGMLIVRVSIGPLVKTFRYFPLQKALPEGNFTIASPRSTGGLPAKMAAVVDTLNISAVGYVPKKISLDSYDATLNVTLASDATAVYNPCPTNGSPCKILPFGDSITQGAASSDNAGYRSQLYKLIVAAKQKATFVGSQTGGPTTVSGVAFPRSHEGHPGWKIGGSGSTGSGIYSLVPSPALEDNPHIILLLIGANDVFSEKTVTDGMAARLDALLEKVAQGAPTSLIVLAQMTPIGTSNNGHTAAQVAAANAAQAKYNSQIPGIIQAHTAKGQHIIGVDMSKMPLSDLTTSSMHPNDKGYAYMSTIWYPAIKDLLPK